MMRVLELPKVFKESGLVSIRRALIERYSDYIFVIENEYQGQH